MSETTHLLAVLVLHLGLTALPIAAAMLVAARLGIRGVPLLLAIGLLASGLTGMLGFWAYYGERLIGETLSFLVVFASVAAAAWALWGGHLPKRLLGALALPLGLWLLGTAFLYFLGYAHGGAEIPLHMATARFSHPLPGDHMIPDFFADWFFAHGHDGVPAVFPGEWRSSDRPPLQVGYALLQRPFHWNPSGTDYQAMAVGLQQLWIVGLWALLVAARVGRVTKGLVLTAALLSPLAIVNGFFVWPKLLPAAMTLAVAALVLTPSWERVRSSLWGAALVAGLCGVAMMGHGSTVFALVALAAAAAWRGLPGWRWIGVGALVGVLIMAPWSAFQKYEDPPGNRVVKWTLAGVEDIDDRGTVEAIVDSYREAGVSGALENKRASFRAIVGGREAFDTLRGALDSGDLEEVVRSVRVVGFFYLLPSMWLLLLAPLAMLAGLRRARAPAEWALATRSLAVFAIGTVIWGLVLWGGEEFKAVVHHSAYGLPLLGIAGAVAGLRSVFPRIAIGVVAVQAVLMLAVYAPALDPVPGSAYSAPAIILAALSLAGFAAASFWPRGGGPAGEAGPGAGSDASRDPGRRGGPSALPGRSAPIP